MTTFNTDLAERVLAQIKDHPETWDQSAWRCETGMCFAGWAAELDGQKWALASPTEDWEASTVLASGEHAADYASKALGLDPDRQRQLFYSGNDLDRIEQLVKHYANNPFDSSNPDD